MLAQWKMSNELVNFKYDELRWEFARSNVYYLHIEQVQCVIEVTREKIFIKNLALQLQDIQFHGAISRIRFIAVPELKFNECF